MYKNGLCVDKDYNEAIKWFQLSANQCNSRAQKSLDGNDGDMYFNGYGTIEDKNEAFEWMNSCASHGNPIAQEHLGTMYRYGWGTIKDENAALKMYNLSADQNNVNAQLNSGMMCLNGIISATQKGEPDASCLSDMEKVTRFFDLLMETDMEPDMEPDMELYIDKERLKKQKVTTERFITYLLRENNDLKKKNNDNEKLIEHLKLFPGTDYKEAMNDYQKACELCLQIAIL